MIVSPPSGNWTLGAGATWLLLTATRDEFGRDQWGAGRALVLGCKTKQWLAGIFPQYTWGCGGSNTGPDASYGSMLYWFVWNLPDSWQIGTNPTITYDNNAAFGNQWNVPVGLFVSKTAKVGKVPVNFHLGVEYSVVSQDAFGQLAQIKLNIIPVTSSLMKHPIFSG